MKQQRARFTALLLAFLLAAGMFSGCVQTGRPESSPAAPALLATAEPAATAEQRTPEPIETPEPKGDAQEAARLFHALDTDVFRAFATSDGYTLHRLLTSPETYGISLAPEQYTWGSLSEAAAAEDAAQAAAFLEALHAIDRELLAARDQLSYDVLEQYLQLESGKGAYFGYYEPLEQSAGVQVQLPLALALCRLETAEDIQRYLALMADTPRYFSEVLAYEKLRSERGLFMTEEALSAVISDCNTVIHHGKDFFLFAAFDDAVDAMEGLSRSERNEYRQQNAEAVENSLVPAFTLLRDGLQALAATCRPMEGAYAGGEEAIAYYALRLQEESSALLTPEDALALLEPAMQDMFITMQTIYAEDASVASGKLKISAGSAKKDMAYLETLSKNLLPQLPEHSLTLREIPREMGERMGAAAYVIPPLDAEKAHTLLLNPRQEDNTLLLTLAHEGYPGHLCQYLYQRSIEGLGLTQRALTFGGYAEGWAQMAEEWIILEQTRYDQNATMFAFCNSMLSSAILPSVVSIYVNYYGYERDDVQEYLNQYGLGDAAHADLYFRLAVNAPYGTLRYAIGYAQLSEMMRGMSELLGEAYLQQEVLQQYLDYGPAYFNLIQERMDEWADARVLE